MCSVQAYHFCHKHACTKFVFLIHTDKKKQKLACWMVHLWWQLSALDDKLAIRKAETYLTNFNHPPTQSYISLFPVLKVFMYFPYLHLLVLFWGQKHSTDEKAWEILYYMKTLNILFLRNQLMCYWRYTWIYIPYLFYIGFSITLEFPLQTLVKLFTVLRQVVLAVPTKYCTVSIMQHDCRTTFNPQWHPDCPRSYT
jgi:hypothetical protein